MIISAIPCTSKNVVSLENDVAIDIRVFQHATYNRGNTKCKNASSALYPTIDDLGARKYIEKGIEDKAELRERLYDALVELEERDNYWR